MAVCQCVMKWKKHTKSEGDRERSLVSPFGMNVELIDIEYVSECRGGGGSEEKEEEKAVDVHV